MYLDTFDRRIVDVLRVEDRSMRLAELVKATGFARSINLACGLDGFYLASAALSVRFP